MAQLRKPRLGASIRMGSVIAIAMVLSPILAAEVTSVQRTDDGLVVRRGESAVQLQIFDDRIIRVRYAASGKFSDPAFSAVIAKPQPATFELVDRPTHVGIKTAAVEALVDRGTGAVSFADIATAQVFLIEAPDGRASTTTQVRAGEIHGVGQTFLRQAGEAIIGLGQHQDGQFNYTGVRVRLLQENTKIGVPVLTSSAGYTLLWDNAAVTEIDAGKDRVKWSSESGDTIDYYVCYGPDLKQAIAGYRKLTGDAPMFARWAWGLWQCRERYVKQEDLLNTAREYRARKIPIDGIIQDWQYWFPQPWGSHAFGSNFPDPSAAVKELKQAHFHTLISVWAKFDKGSANYDEMEAAGHLYPPVYPNVYPKGEAKWYDAFNPEARKMYWRQMNEQIAVHGWDGWWLDATEPELGGKWGEMRDLQTNAGPGYAVFNAYPLMTTTGVYEGQRARKPEVRPLILTRSAYAGQQRNGAIAWSGDVGGNWEVFQRQIPAGLNFVATGIPYWNTDTGGFFGGDPKDEGYRELFIRWFQFSTFCPMLRIHGTGEHKPLWAFGDEAGKTLMKFNELRYRLLPYIYSTSWQVTSERALMMRPLLIDYREDANTHNIPDQFLFGPSLMVCPVTQPIGGSLALIPSDHLIDATGKPGGLSATYYQGMQFEREVMRRVDSVIDFDWDHVKREGVGANPRKDPIPGMKMDGFSVRWEGSVRTQKAGTYTLQLRADDGMRMWIDGKLVVEDWRSRNVATSVVKVDLPANSRVPIKIEYYQDRAAAIIDLRWKPPTEDEAKPFTRSVYLPKGTWFDFWTGRTISGGERIEAPAPIERLPLFVKAGAIIPMGPVVQYANEQPDAPLEIRIYPGADGAFTLYDDAGDGYGYEKGERAIVHIKWDDRAGKLTFGKRIGQYPAMPEKRTFNIVIVNERNGAGSGLTPRPAHTIEYDGTEQTVGPLK